MQLSTSHHQHYNLSGRVLKVNHAGEHGAVHIYAGQLLTGRFTAPSMRAELAEFKAHEQGHRAVFEAELRRRGLRRCRSYWLCAVGGYALGAVTGLFGRHAIAATTVAVERVVLGHLRWQIAALQATDPQAAAAIARIVEDEQSHLDRSTIRAQGGRLWLKVLQPVVSLSTEAVIWLGMRL